MARRRRRKDKQPTGNKPTNDSTADNQDPDAKSNDDPTAKAPKSEKKSIVEKQSMTRLASLAVLLAIIFVSLFLFYQVMAQFILPLFLAALFAVIFRPVHRWMLGRLKNRETLAAGLTTTMILGIVLLPLIGTLGLAGYEAYKRVAGFTEYSQEIRNKLNELGKKLNWHPPFASYLSQIEEQLSTIPDSLPTKDEIGEETVFSIDFDLAPALRLKDEIQHIYDQLAADEIDLENANENVHSVRRMKTSRQVKYQFLREVEEEESVSEDGASKETSANKSEASKSDPNPTTSSSSEATLDERVFTFDELDDFIRVLNETRQYFENNFREFDYAIDLQARVLNDPAGERDDLTFLHREFPKLKIHYWEAKKKIRGGLIRSGITTVFYPPKSTFDEAVAWAKKNLETWLPSVGLQATSVITSFAIGICIMVLGIFYFLKDGPGMIRAVMRLSPLDDRYELQLLTEFDKVSRAVVLATLLSAIAQGLLAGIGYWVCLYLLSHSPEPSLGTVFLLTLITMVLAMVPFVGAAAVWVPTCIWLALVDNRLITAGIFAVYGFGAVSMVDNLVKPLVLHGQSNIHPLLALLSVIGGVAALGPIGIVVGPMVVAFLQALLNMLQHELQHFDS